MSLKPPTKSEQNPAPRCQHVRADGKRCALPRAANHKSLCVYHRRRDEERADRIWRTPEAAAMVAEVLGSLDKIRTKTAVNDAVSKLFSLRARKLISARDTAILGYLIQLNLQTLQGVDYEFNRIHDSAVWNGILAKAIRDACGPDAPELQLAVSTPPRRKRHKVPRTRREFAEAVFAELGVTGRSEDEPEPERESALQAPPGKKRIRVGAHTYIERPTDPPEPAAPEETAKHPATEEQGVALAEPVEPAQEAVEPQVAALAGAEVPAKARPSANVWDRYRSSRPVEK